MNSFYVTTGPNPDKARIAVRRVDGAVFDQISFTALLLANAGAGRACGMYSLQCALISSSTWYAFDAVPPYG